MSDETPDEATPDEAPTEAIPAEAASTEAPMATEATEPEIPVAAPTAALPTAPAAVVTQPVAPAPAPAKATKAVAVPVWLLVSIAALIGAVVMFGIGYAVGDSSNDSESVAVTAPVPGANDPFNPGNGNPGNGNQGNGNRGNGNQGNGNQVPTRPETPTRPQTPSASGAFLGVATRAVDDGLEITQVVSGSAADDAGLEVGDVIVEFDDDEVTTSAELANAVGALDPGDEVDVTYERDGQTRTATVELGTRATASS